MAQNNDIENNILEDNEVSEVSEVSENSDNCEKSESIENINEEDKVCNAIAKREELENNLVKQSNMWGYSPLGLEAKRAANAMASMKSGLYSRVPLICKGEKCPYKDTCKLLTFQLTPIGEYCPLETTNIETSIKKYADEFKIGDDDFTDQRILKELVSLEIIMDRCMSLMSGDQSLVVDVVDQVAEDGTIFTRPEINQAFEIYERTQVQHNKLLNLMNATRKDKEGKVAINDNPFSVIMNKINDLKKDGDFIEIERPTILYEDKT